MAAGGRLWRRAAKLKKSEGAAFYGAPEPYRRVKYSRAMVWAAISCELAWFPPFARMVVMSLTSFLEQFVRSFVPEPFHQLARQTGWCQRAGKIDAFEFLIALVFGQLSASRQTLSSQAQTLGEPVTRQAVDQRFNARTVEYLRAAFAQVMTQTLDWSPAHPQAEALRAGFSAVYLLDSTGFDCPQALQDIFPACGGAGSAANVKLLMRYELIAGRLEPLAVLAGRRSDQGQALAAAERLSLGEREQRLPVGWLPNDPEIRSVTQLGKRPALRFSLSPREGRGKRSYGSRPPPQSIPSNSRRPRTELKRVPVISRSSVRSALHARLTFSHFPPVRPRARPRRFPVRRWSDGSGRRSY